MVSFDRPEDLAAGAEEPEFVTTWLSERRTDLTAGVRIPEPEVPLVIVLCRCGECDLAVSAQHEERIRARKLQDLPDRLTRVGVPDPRGPVFAGGQHGRAIGAECHGH